MDKKQIEMDHVTKHFITMLKGGYTKEQSLKIIVGLSSLQFLSVKEQAVLENVNLTHVLKDHLFEESLKREVGKLYHFNNGLYEILTYLLEPVFNYHNKSVNYAIKDIAYRLTEFPFNETNYLVEFINQLVTTPYTNEEIYGTPDTLKKLLIGLVDFKEIQTFADYCSGVSSVAIDVFRYLKKMEYRQGVFYYGEEKNVSAYLISQLLMIINDIQHSKIINKDVLERVSWNEHIEKFDFVFTDAPIGISWDKQEANNDPRYKYGIPAKSSADWAFYQNAIYHLRDQGIAIVVGTKGALVRKSDTEIRKAIIEDDLIDTIITLPSNLYHGTNVGTELIIFNKQKREQRRNKVLFIDASEYSNRLNRNQYAITEEGMAKIIATYKDGLEEERFSRFIDVEKIRDYNYALNSKEYLDVDVLKNTFDQTILLGEVAEIRRGVQISKEDYETLSSEPTHYLLNIKDIDNGIISYDGESRITFKKPDWIGKFAVQPNDILITCKGSVVKIAIVPENYKEAFVTGNLSIIRVNPQKYNAYVLYEFLQSEIGLRMIEGIQTGTTIKILNPSKLEQLELPLYALSKLHEIGNQIKQNKNEYESVINEAEKKYLMNKQNMIEALGFHR